MTQRKRVVPAKAGTHAEFPEFVLLKHLRRFSKRILLLSMGPRLRGDDVSNRGDDGG